MISFDSDFDNPNFFPQVILTNLTFQTFNNSAFLTPHSFVHLSIDSSSVYHSLIEKYSVEDEGQCEKFGLDFNLLSDERKEGQLKRNQNSDKWKDFSLD